MVTITRQLPIRVPGNYGDYETYCDLSDTDGYLNFLNGETISMAPTRGDVPSSAYYNKNIRVMFNEGQITPNGMPKKWRTLFAKNGAIADIMGNTPFNQATPDQCKAIAARLYEGKGGYGFIHGESQENESIHKFQTQYAPTQIKQVYQAITDYGLANPADEIINGGMIYASVTTAWWMKQAGNVTVNYQTLKDALSTRDQATALIIAFEWDFHRYYSLGLYETGAIPNINGYTVHNDNHLQFWKTVMQMELVAKANEGRFADPRTMSVFFWDRAKEIQPYTEGYQVDLGGGVTMLQQEFCTPNPNLVYALNRIGFRHGKHCQGWENPYGFGKNPNIVPQAGDRTGYVNNNTGSKQVVSQYIPVPNTSGQAVGYPNAPFGYNDLLPVAAKMHCKQTEFLNKRPVAVQWSINGVSGPAPDAGYIPYCIDNHKPLIRAAVDGNRAIVDVFDPEGWGGVVNVNLGGVFGTVALDCWPNADNQFHLQA